MENATPTKVATAQEELRKKRIVGGAFLATVAGVAGVFGFSRTVMAAKKQDASIIEKGIVGVQLMDAGHGLALRALAWGTFYAFVGTGAFCYGVWKLSGAKNFEEFRQTMGSKLPRLTSTAPPTSRTEFDGMNDLMKYLTSWGHD